MKIVKDNILPYVSFNIVFVEGNNSLDQENENSWVSSVIQTKYL